MITNRFIHVHLPRTAGNTLRHIARQLRDYDVVILDDVSHRPLPEMQARCAELGIAVPPAVAFVREPWRWYPSQWRWLRYTQHADFTGDFAAYMTIVRRRCFSDWNWFSFTGCYNLLGAANADYTGTVCTFEDDVHAICARYAPAVPAPAIQQAIREAGVVNASPHDLACTWRREDVAWVQGEDAAILEKCGYPQWPKVMED